MTDNINKNSDLRDDVLIDDNSAPLDGAPIEPVESDGSLPEDGPDDVPAGEVMADAPDVSPNVDDLLGDGAGDTPRPPSSADGETFNPDIHVVDKLTGEPKRNKDGSFRRRPGRRKKSEDVPGSVVAEAAHAVSQGAKAAAIVTVSQVEIIGRLIGGDEWAYVKRDDLGIDERQQGVDAFTAYFEANGVVDIPPGVAIAIWGFGYVAPRFTMPKTQSRVKLVGAWIGNKWTRFRHKKGGKKHGARPDSGHDGKR